MCILCVLAHVSGVVQDAHIHICMCLFLVFVHMYLSLCLAWSKMKGVCQWGRKKGQGVGGRKKTKSINMKTKMGTKGETMLKDIRFVKPPE